MVEKLRPEHTPTNLTIIWRYILTPGIFAVLENTAPDKNSDIQITDALMILAKQGRVVTYKFQDARYDCGSVKSFVIATSHFCKGWGCNLPYL